MKYKEDIRKINKSRRNPIVFFALFLFAFNLGIHELQANVRPDILTRQELPVDIFKIHDSLARNFHPKSEAPSNSIPANHPVRSAATSQEEGKCYFQESFRLLADRGQTIALIVFTGLISGYVYEPDPLTCLLPFVGIKSRTGECTRIRPPPLV